MTKQEFIDDFIKKEKPKDMLKATAFIQENLKIARENNIVFTREEIHTLISDLSKNLPESNRRQVNMLLKKL